MTHIYMIHIYDQCIYDATKLAYDTYSVITWNALLWSIFCLILKSLLKKVFNNTFTKRILSSLSLPINCLIEILESKSISVKIFDLFLKSIFWHQGPNLYKHFQILESILRIIRVRVTMRRVSQRTALKKRNYHLMTEGQSYEYSWVYSKRQE